MDNKQLKLNKLKQKSIISIIRKYQWKIKTLNYYITWKYINHVKFLNYSKTNSFFKIFNNFVSNTSKFIDNINNII